jgi:DNA polymerase III subunit epsilon
MTASPAVRQVVLDTETTGLAVEKGHRVVEIGCVELLERRPSGRRFQRYLNPQRAMDAGAQEVTGLTDDFLADKPLFADVADDFLAFVAGAELVIHNAAFDVGFLDAELARVGRGPLAAVATVTDSLALARERYPGQRNSLDALCKRLDVDNAHRTLHGALLDAQLLAEVYLAMTAGQGDLGLDLGGAAGEAGRDAMVGIDAGAMRLRVRRANRDELARHAARIESAPAPMRALWEAWA